MKILFLSDNFPPERNAPASSVHERACHWVRWGHDVTVVTCAPNFPEGKLYEGYDNRWYGVSVMDGIRVVRVKTYISANSGKLKRTLDYVSFMASGGMAGLWQDRPDVVVGTSPQFFTAVAACGVGMLRRIPFVMEVRDLWPDSIAAVGAMRKRATLRMLEKLELELYRRAARVVALTGAFKRNLVRRGVNEDKVEVVLNGVDGSRYSPRKRDRELGRLWGLGDEHFVVGYVGTLGMAHGLDNVLRVAARAGDADLRFLFVGAGAERARLMAEAERMKLRNVIFVAAQPKEAMPSYWSLCDVALVHLRDTPLFKTVIPSKIFEAMGMGLPILLASPKGEASEVLSENGAGMWVPPEQPEALLDAIRAMRNDQVLYDRLAASSRAAAPRYSRERQSREMLAILGEVAGLKEAKTFATAAR